MALNIDPATATFPATGGNATHNIVSLSESRLAFKVKSSNNENYRVKPVYGFLDSKVKSSNNENYRVKPVYGFLDSKATAQLEIARTAGLAKEDKLVIQWAEVPAEETDPQAPFKAGAQAGEVILPLKAE